jgi:hypothetical protein
LYCAGVLAENPALDQADTLAFRFGKSIAAVQNIQHPKQANNGIEAVFAVCRIAESVPDGPLQLWFESETAG